MFPGLEGRAAHVGMDCRRGQVEDEIDRRVGQYVGKWPGRYAEFLGFGLGPTHVHIGTSDQVQAERQTIFEISAADMAAAYNGDLSFCFHAPVPFPIKY